HCRHSSVLELVLRRRVPLRQSTRHGRAMPAASASPRDSTSRSTPPPVLASTERNSSTHHLLHVTPLLSLNNALVHYDKMKRKRKSGKPNGRDCTSFDEDVAGARRQRFAGGVQREELW